MTAIGWLFIAAGSIGLVYHASELETQGPIDYDVVLVLFVRMLAIIAGVFMLRGADWARWPSGHHAAPPEARCAPRYEQQKTERPTEMPSGHAPHIVLMERFLAEVVKRFHAGAPR